MPGSYSTRGHDFKSTSYRTIAACIDVQKQLGVHCMEVDYQRALELALPKYRLRFQHEMKIPIAYDGVVVTKQRIDFVIWDEANEFDELLLETKARSEILPEDIEQCLLSAPGRLPSRFADQLGRKAVGHQAAGSHTAWQTAHQMIK